MTTTTRSIAVGNPVTATWLIFDEQPPVPGRKTKVYIVRTKGSSEEKPGGQALGKIVWWGAWRRYSFFPLPNTLYEATCLRDIADFLERLMVERRAACRGGAA